MAKFITVVISMVIFFTLHPQAYDMPCKNNDDSPVAVVIMVQNEVDSILSTLQPFVDTGITNFLVFDTGSIDGTQNKVHEYFNQCGFEHAYIIEEPFIDFETLHRRAFNLAEQIFHNTTLPLVSKKEPYTILFSGCHPLRNIKR